MTNFWDLKKIAFYVKRYIDQENIGTVFTFDTEGVSRHPNHIACRGAVPFLQETLPEVNYYELASRNLVRKYWGILDFFLCVNEDIAIVNWNPILAYNAMKNHYS
jgi:N-acetylglucosaminylphosphatidylinositol deacetylase